MLIPKITRWKIWKTT